MLRALRVYKEVGYDGMIMPDHAPGIDGDAGGSLGVRLRLRLHPGVDSGGVQRGVSEHMLTFPQILIGVFTAAGALLAIILLVVLLPRRDESRSPKSLDPLHRVNGRNGDGPTP